MNRRRFLLTALGSLTVSSIFASCSQQSTQNSTNTQTISQKEQKEVIKVGVTGILSQDILKFVNNNIAAKEGLEIQVVTFNDWIQPNTALRDKVIDANFFQHRPFMNNASKELNLNLVALNTVYLNTLGLFSNKLKSVSEIPQNATVTIANDVINNDRGLRLLATNGLIKLKENPKQFVTQRDIAANPKNLKIKEVEGVQVVRAINDVDFIVSSAQTVALAGIEPNSMGEETAKDKKYALALVTLQGRENEPQIQKLNKLLVHPNVKDFINKEYKGRIIPVF
ncbi:MAG: MetQ/NlpA family ABC transporter substrate-binding protein [Nostoc sp. DedVER02]|uniref:MetQ/NlpA family ABC transporter substrate-binding protein n=1 Tax=unclassified Nostoc TaxID=2593658 RepID=UPI002AD4C330|nr:MULTISPECIES: MetQ/NlpA family ABC transporter substrate-binding protein [unclassified Nostoc]MDZ7989023.1 MetQ/NlpA family ABC transporter substrate-binding protein [Nostoc sp. DedVER02]MDZ8114818.1 MetQ/NlpA family ABC transporter substrate-binding protein [Nostoc sp. DedVER01b]